ncbi:MAG: pyroglutamyl-peptidase I family protein [Fimbriimonadaceae bacterium]
MALRVFVTGFLPFGTVADNPSAALASACGVPHRVLEVSWDAVDAWLATGEPDHYDVLIHLGFAPRRHVTPELFARNVIGPTPDVRGVMREGCIEADGPTVVGSTLWTPTLLAGLISDPSLKVSEDAGAYLCNYLGYRALRRFPDKLIGFVHVPAFDQILEVEQLRVLESVFRNLQRNA